MKSQILLTALLALTATQTSRASASVDSTAQPANARDLLNRQKLPRLTAPEFDLASDGTTWVRGGNYKASFDARGATYYPIFGSKTPRHFPLHMRLSSATSGEQAIALVDAKNAVRDGDRITLDRGMIDEVYETSLEGLEQTFVVESRPQGDLQLFVQIDTELAVTETDDGFVFANEYGRVKYGRAFVREADGTQHAVATHLVQGGVEIDVDAAYLAKAKFPLVVDPFVGQFGITSTALDQRLSDIAFDASTNTFMVAFEEVVAGNDRDIRTMTLDITGNNLVATSYVDTTTEDWNRPSIANLNSGNRFLVVASVGNYAPYNVPGLQYNMVVGRGCTASSPSAWGAKFLVLATETGLNNRYDVSVGGDDSTSGATAFFVAWSEAIPNGAAIEGRRVSSAFLPLGNVVTLSTSSGNVRPSVSKHNGGSRWNVVWERSGDLFGAQVSNTGAIVTSEFTVANSALSEVAPSAASPFTDGSWATVWQQNSAGGERDLYCKVFSGSTLVAERNLSASYPSTQTLDQRMPSIDCDGERIAVSYSEAKSGNATDFDIYVSSYFSIEGRLQPSEIHAPITTSTTSAIESHIVSTQAAGASGRRFGIAYTMQATLSDDIFGALYDLPDGGSITPICAGDGTANSCPCGNVSAAGRGCPNSINASGALLTATGVARIGADTVLLSGSGMNNSSVLYFQGTNQPGSGVPFGDGLRCTVGTIVRLGIKTNVAGASAVPSGNDAKLSVLGHLTGPTTHTYQAWYRDPASFCTVSTFNLTNGVFIVWGL